MRKQDRLRASVLVICLFAASGKALLAASPNIVLIMADDVGADAIGCYGGGSFPTPNIDRLAQQGMRFDHCYSMPSCHPTRVCLLTGRYPRNIDNPRWGSFPKQLESQSLAVMLKNSGYATCVTGKWQLTLLGRDPQQPHRLGFDSYNLFGWHEGPRYYEPLIWRNGKTRDDVEKRYGPDVYSDELLAFIQANANRPFFAYFPMALCHDVTDDLDAPTPYGPRGRYDTFPEMMREMDRIVGKVVQGIDRLQLSRRTLILFTGDNGTPIRSIVRHEDGKYIREPVFTEYRGKRIPGGKTKLTDGGTHVPLIARWVGVVPAGARNDALVDFSDFWPTFRELAGKRTPNLASLDGVSFAGELTGEGDTERTFAYAEAKGRFFVRDRRWKLYSDKRFFDVAADRFETKQAPSETLSPAGQAARTRLMRAFNEVSRQDQ